MPSRASKDPKKGPKRPKNDYFRQTGNHFFSKLHACMHATLLWSVGLLICQSIEFHLYFLVAVRWLYKRLCPSVGLSVHWSIGPSVCWSIGPSVCWSISPSVCHAWVVTRELKISAFSPLPTHPQLVWPCIRPCSELTGGFCNPVPFKMHGRPLSLSVLICTQLG